MDGISPTASSAFNINHIDIIAAVSKDLGFVEKIDKRIPRFDVRRIVSNENAVLAIVLNGLGFSNLRMYLMP